MRTLCCRSRDELVKLHEHSCRRKRRGGRGDLVTCLPTQVRRHTGRRLCPSQMETRVDSKQGPSQMETRVDSKQGPLSDGDPCGLQAGPLVRWRPVWTPSRAPCQMESRVDPKQGPLSDGDPCGPSGPLYTMQAYRQAVLVLCLTSTSAHFLNQQFCAWCVQG